MSGKVSQVVAIKNFLVARSVPDLANLYNKGMECQVNVAQDGGSRVDGEFKGRQWHGWTDGIQTWKSFRIPYKANTEPEYQDKDISFDLAQHVEGIGMTGWDWINRCSRWVAFDFDSITGHSPNAKNSLSDSDLSAVKKAACDLDWVSVRYSASGRGLHIYVMLEPTIHTSNHNEHSALARSILGKMSAITGFDFSAKVDACGGNMWVWHRKMYESGTRNQGLTLIKAGNPLTDVPANWQEHVKVVSGQRKRNIPKFIEDKNSSQMDKLFEELSGQRTCVPLDTEHRELIKYLEQQEDFVWWWDSDNHMLVTHTLALANAHTELGLKGIFKTVSVGSDKDTQNCFCYPLKGGAWTIRRFTQGVQEAETWEQDTAGWTKCTLNREPDLRTACRVKDGVESEKGGFLFNTSESAIEAAKHLGVAFGVPNWAACRQTKLKVHKDGRLVVEVKAEKSDRHEDMKGWLLEKDTWKRIFNKEVSLNNDQETLNYDNVIRHLTTSEGEDQGWMLFSDSDWRNEPLAHLKVACKSLGLTPPEIESLLGSCVLNCWKIVNKPFQPEYPGDRCWNLNSAQFRFIPTNSKDNLNYPTWNMILEHVGSGLDETLKGNEWAVNNGIIKGADYIKCWIASLFQEPTEPLPYLFLHGPQNSGKSILHEALSLLLTKGYQRADNCLSAKTEFNGELEGAIICVVEEVDLNHNKVAYNKIKDWVTSRHLNIRHLYKSPYHVRNSTHWIHCANDAKACPVFTGDTRITMINVPSLDSKNLISKKIMIPRLEQEANDFLAAVLSLELPTSNDRLNIPVISTGEKEMIQSQNNSSLEQFIEENCFPVEGEFVSVSEFHAKFLNWLPPEEIHEWSKIRIGRELPSQYPKGRMMVDGHFYIGNLSFVKKEPTRPKLIIADGKLIPVRTV